MSQRVLTALPVYNEAKYVASVVSEVRRYSPEVLVVNDGSNDGTGELLAAIDGIHRVTHTRNLGYGAALRSAFDFAQAHRYEVLVTIDCDGQHQPRRIPRFVAACAGWDIVSGSRYLEASSGESAPPPERRKINEELTAELNRTLGLKLTDAFCGFKAYRVAALGHLHITETGWGMPLQLWVQAARLGLRVKEVGVPRLYLDPNRAFGGMLNDAAERLAYYRRVIQDALAETGAHPAVGHGPHRHACPSERGSCR
ncbi:MAG TPA: glycosyltransferase family 2 protein [Pirellulales bacterium]|nr:glycosyltransferase family 2 protein [Pirellulales bacterium]